MISLKSLLAEDIKKDVDKFIDKLNKQFPDQEYTISSGGGKYVRINHKSRKFGGESAWGFIALVDNPSKGFQKGDLLKAAGYNTPAKHARGNILNGTAKYDKYSPTYLKEEIKEAKSDYPVYHFTYTSAINAAREYAEKKGYEIDDDDAFRKIGMGPKRPSAGKTNRFSIELMKGGKPQKKLLHIQVYNMGTFKRDNTDGSYVKSLHGGQDRYELNAYIN